MIADPDRGTRGVLGLANGPDMYEAPPGGHKDHQRGETAPLQAARRANADQLPEQHAEVEAQRQRAAGSAVAQVTEPHVPEPGALPDDVPGVVQVARVLDLTRNDEGVASCGRTTGRHGR